MIEISYGIMFAIISIIWCINRALVAWQNKGLNWKRELELLLVYICIVVIVRFTFCPYGKVNGHIQPLLFDAGHILPFRTNLIPLVHLFDYEIRGEAILNFVGNTFMFVPVGIVYPIVYKKLDTHMKVIFAGVGFSLVIELIQLPFFDRVSDIDDLILNSLGYVLGYFIYLGVNCIKAQIRNKENEK